MNRCLRNQGKGKVPLKMFLVRKLYRCTTNTWGQLIVIIKCVLILLLVCNQKTAPRIFFFLLETSIVNAFICELESTNHTPRNQLEFRVDLVQKLVENFSGRKDQGRPRIHPLKARFTERHFPTMKREGPRSESAQFAKLVGR